MRRGPLRLRGWTRLLPSGVDAVCLAEVSGGDERSRASVGGLPTRGDAASRGSRSFMEMGHEAAFPLMAACRRRSTGRESLYIEPRPLFSRRPMRSHSATGTAAKQPSRSALRLNEMPSERSTSALSTSHARAASMSASAHSVSLSSSIKPKFFGRHSVAAKSGADLGYLFASQRVFLRSLCIKSQSSSYLSHGGWARTTNCLGVCSCESVSHSLWLSLLSHTDFSQSINPPVSKASTLHFTVGKQSQYCYKTHSLTIINEHK